MQRQMLCAMWQISVAVRLSPSLQHQEEENIWQVRKLGEERGKPKKGREREKKIKQLFVYFPLIYGRTCGCLLCVSSV